jgi:HNH endonuclease
VRRTRPLAERVFEKVEPTLFCWVWHGAICKKTGYGKVGLGRRSDGVGLVHRVVYELLVGPVPDGLDLDHLCRNRACCNPDHLEPVTRKVNVARGLHAKGWRDSITECPRGHTYDYHNGRQRICRTCHREDARATRARRKAAA